MTDSEQRPEQQRGQHPRRSRYIRYSGGDPLTPPVDLREALDAIGEEVMAGYSPDHALREFLRRGGRTMTGLDDLAQRVAKRRSELLSRHNLDGTMREVRELLDAAVLAERKQLARDLDDDARFAEMRIDGLPASTAAAVTELAQYPWRSAQAREAYEQIKDLLGREALEARFAGMKQALLAADDSTRESVQRMLSDLGDLLEKHRDGTDTPADFEEFMRRHGEFFPESPRDVDELIDQMAKRSAAAARMMNSMTPEQRAELMELSAQAFGTPELAQALSRIDSALQDLRPGEDWTGGEQFRGSQGLGLGDGTGALVDIAELDALAEQLSQQYAGADLRDLDLDALARQLGAESVTDARTLAELEAALTREGYLTRGSDGVSRLSPKAMRRLGKELLRDVAGRLSGRTGQRETRHTGLAGEATGASAPWEFGSTQPWDVTRTVTNALTRTAAAGGMGRAHETPGASVSPGDDTARPPGRVRIELDDVVVTETETRTRAAVALCVDTSFSMAIEGRWVPMKRTALALHQLVSSRFRGDDLELIAFGRYARSLDIERLTALEPEYEQGTNLHHALMLAGRFFRRHPSAQPVLLVVTDGEPTSHLLPDGQAFFDWPPHPVSLASTISELDTAKRLGTQVTFFRLGDDPGLEQFIDSLARRVGGRAVAPDLLDLDTAVLHSYLDTRDA